MKEMGCRAENAVLLTATTSNVALFLLPMTIVTLAAVLNDINPENVSENRKLEEATDAVATTACSSGMPTYVPSVYG